MLSRERYACNQSRAVFAAAGVQETLRGEQMASARCGLPWRAAAALRQLSPHRPVTAGRRDDAT